MGNDSEQLVLDYLSRVGDLAHGTSMTAAERAGLVGRLRSDIERRRAETDGVETTASVRRILKGLGKPEEVVASATGSEIVVPGPRTSGPSPTRGAGPSVRDLSARLLGGRRDRTGGRPSGGAGSGAAGADDAVPDTFAGPSADVETDIPAPRFGAGFTAGAPHLAGMDELTEAESDPNWWRNDPSPYAKGKGGEVSGFVGGIEIPEMLKPPGKEGEPGDADQAVPPSQPGAPAAEQDPHDAAGQPAEVPPGKGLLGRIRDGGGAPDGVRRAGGVVELGAVLALVAGAVLGNLFVLGLGWLMAWWSPRLSRNEAKWAAAGMPGLVAVATIVWLWGRMDERWGEPVADGAMGEAMNESYPWVLRAAAGASAVFLLWRARRPR